MLEQKKREDCESTAKKKREEESECEKDERGFLGRKVQNYQPFPIWVIQDDCLKERQQIVPNNLHRDWIFAVS